MPAKSSPKPDPQQKMDRIDAELGAALADLFGSVENPLHASVTPSASDEVYSMDVCNDMVDRKDTMDLVRVLQSSMDLAYEHDIQQACAISAAQYAAQYAARKGADDYDPDFALAVELSKQDAYVQPPQAPVTQATIPMRMEDGTFEYVDPETYRAIQEAMQE